MTIVAKSDDIDAAFAAVAPDTTILQFLGALKKNQKSLITELLSESNVTELQAEFSQYDAIAEKHICFEHRVRISLEAYALLNDEENLRILEKKLKRDLRVVNHAGYTLICYYKSGK